MPAPRGSKRSVAVAGRNVKHALAGTKIKRFAEILADNLQRGADDGVIAGRPGALLFRLHGNEIGCRSSGGRNGSQCRGGHGRSLKAVDMTGQIGERSRRDLEASLSFA